MSYIRSLLDDAGLTEKEFNEALAMWEEGLTHDDCQKWIPRLKKKKEILNLKQRVERLEKELEPSPQPREPGAPVVEGAFAIEAVPAGRYAIRSKDRIIRFYRVDKPTEGKWTGYTFVKIQAGERFHKLPQDSQTRALREIAEVGPKEASQLYGKELGHCGVCGRILTNQESRDLGIGPICAGKMGWL